MSAVSYNMKTLSLSLLKFILMFLLLDMMLVWLKHQNALHYLLTIIENTVVGRANILAFPAQSAKYLWYSFGPETVPKTYKDVF